MSELNAKPIERDKVVNIINSVIQKVEAAEEVSRENIFKELKSLQELIEQTRTDIGQTMIADVSLTHIPTATDELDAVVEATEVATGTIMDSCDSLSAEAENMDPHYREFIMGEVTKILEACSFQDITGQRITKVIRSLKSIEEKVGSLVNVLSENIPALHTNVSKDTRTGDAKLMNGPQMPDKAVSQDDIDKLLADLF